MRIYDSSGLLKVNLIATFANPTASVGLAAVNGSASTAMRSDAAPALSQAINPTWTAVHNFTGNVVSPSVAATRLALGAQGGTIPMVQFIDSAAASNAKIWRMFSTGNTMTLDAVDDAYSASSPAMTCTRSGATITRVAHTIDTSASFSVGNAISTAFAATMAHVVARSSVLAAGRALVVQVDANNMDPLTLYSTDTTGNNGFMTFYTETSPAARGSIIYNRAGGVVAYNTTSDVRQKENIVNAGDAGPLIDAIKVRSFKWKNSSATMGFWVIAQELDTVMPCAVSKGVLPEDTWAVDVSKLVPLMVKELQTLRARVKRLEQLPLIAINLPPLLG